MVDLEIRLINVPRYGWLCVAEVEGKEIYRGEFHNSYYTALEYYETWRDERLAND